jgi:putative N6-adenine-specific DNA methylase
MSAFPIHIRCAPGLKALVAEEVRALGLPAEELGAGVGSEGELADVERLNLELGCAQRVLVRVAERKAGKLDRLEAKTGSIAWKKWIAPEQPLTIVVKSQRSRLYHSGAVDERVRRAIGERIGGWRSDGEGVTEARLEVRVQGDSVTYWLDSSGEALHRRGYRLETGKAPLREDLAQALIRVSGWDRRSPLVDPMMGAGTVPIEAARMARAIAPGIDRRFAFEAFPAFERAPWEALRAEARERTVATLPFPIHGSDRNAGAIEITGRNAERAGVKASLTLTHAAISAAPFPESETGALVTNPPWGGRLGKGRDLRPLYQTLGKVAARIPGWRLAFVATKGRLAGQVEGVSKRIATNQGGRDIAFYAR